MVINHLEKLFVTKDTGTVIKELEVEHPAAKMMVMATQMMEQEVRGSSYARLCHTFINPTPSRFSLPFLSLLLSCEVGDGTNFVMVLSGALISNAEELLKMGLSPSEVAEGYELACEKALAILPGEGRSALQRWLKKLLVWDTDLLRWNSKRFGNRFQCYA